MSEHDPAAAAHLALVLQLIADAQTTNYLAVASLTLVLLEHISSFPDGVELVWKSRWGLFNFFYIWIRYFTLILITVFLSFALREQTSDTLCNIFQLVEMVACTLVIFSVDVIIALRVWILFRRSKILLYCMIPLLIAELVTMIVVGYYTVGPLKHSAHIGPILTGCWSTTVPRLFTFYIVPSFITAIVMFVLTMYKCAQTLRTSGGMKTPVITLFLRDGLAWFLVLVLISVVQISLWSGFRPTLAQVPVMPTTGVIAVVGARVLLNIKQVVSTVLVTAHGTTVGEHTVELDHLPRQRTQRSNEPWYLVTAKD
ncbi:hypothetical protein C8J57DRAFT_1341238 [Mycena rebaudengoi]|nr:hypothetical protein C8J57DRAFT_1341238 [Mycena rebaudengoi]